MPQNDDIQIDCTKDQEIYTVGCIHCGKTMFRFSRNAINFYDGDSGEIQLKCPQCGCYTVYHSNGTIRERSIYE